VHLARQIPSGGFFVLNPAVYTSFFVAPRLAIEPQVGFLWLSSGGHSDHLFNVTGQVDYFFRRNDVPSVYAFGAAGITDTSGPGQKPRSVGGGVGYRSPVGGRLTFRVDGRVTHFTEGGGKVIALTASIGGLIGRRLRAHLPERRRFGHWSRR
jgi:hypothetical protein